MGILLHSEVKELDNESSKSSDETIFYPEYVLTNPDERKKLADEFKKIMRSFQLIDSLIDKSRLVGENRAALNFPKLSHRK